MDAVIERRAGGSAVFANRRWLWPFVVFAAAYAAIATAYAIVERVRHVPHSYGETFVWWDGSWYFQAATAGYPNALPTVGGHLTPSTAAFFPLYPMLLRGAAVMTLGNWLAATLLAQVVTGAAMALAVWWYVAEDHGRRAADRAVVLTVLLPGTTVMAMGYTEPLAVALSAWCLLELGRRRWVLAGLAAALGAITRPDMIALTVACLWSAIAAFAKDREAKAFMAPAIAPLAAAAWLGVEAERYHSWSWWFVLERQAWGMRFDFGRANVGRLLWLTSEPARHPMFYVLTDLTFLVFVAGLALAWPKLRPEARVYTLAVAAMSLGSSLPTIRYLFKAWPLTVAGVAMSRRTYIVVAVTLAAAFLAQAAWWPLQGAGSPAP